MHEIESDDGGKPSSIWFQWVHAGTAGDVFGDVHDINFLENMNKRGELAAAITTSWIAVAAVAVILHVHRLGIDSSRLGQWPDISAPSGQWRKPVSSSKMATSVRLMHCRGRWLPSVWSVPSVAQRETRRPAARRRP